MAEIRSNLKQLLAPNQIFALAAKGIEGTKVIAINILIARYFGPEVFGKFAFALGIISLVAIIGEFKLINVLIQRISTNQGQAGTILGSALALNALFSLAGVALVLLGGLIGLYDELTFLIIAVLSLGYIYKIPRSFKAYFVVMERNHLVTMSEFFSAIGCLSLIALVVAFEKSILVISAVKGLDFLFVSLLLFYFYWKQQDKKKLHVNGTEAARLLAAGFPLAISGFVMILFQRIDIFMIKYYIGDEFVGYYTAATNYMMLFTLPGMVLSETLSPHIFKAKMNYSRQRFLSIFIKVGFILSLAMFASSYYVIPAAFGEEFKASIVTALILAMAPLLICIGASAGQLIIKDGLQRHAVKKSAIACLINIVLNSYAIPRFGIAGAAMSTIVSFLYAYYLGHYLIKPLRGLFWEQTKSFIK